MKLIAAVDKNWGIGKSGRLLVSIPDDMQYFRGETMGKVIVCGRKTLMGFPGGRPLPGRTNIILSRRADFSVKGAVTVHSTDELMQCLSAYDTNDIYITGGGSVYHELLDSCDLAYITKIDYAYEADTFFPNLDGSDKWTLVSESEEQTYFDIAYTFCTYKRKPTEGGGS